MRIKTSLLGVLALFFLPTISAQEVSFEEYDLDNGLHVILHQDNNAPVVTTSVMYHVGAKDENPEKQVLPIFLNIYCSKARKT